MAHKVAIIEDDEKIVFALSVRLKAAGYHVISAYDPIRGLSLIVKEEPDLVLLDLTMPAGGGLKLAERLRNMPQHVATPIIVITANKQPEPRIKAETLNLQGFLEKPFETNELMMAIEQCLGQAKAS